MAATWLDIIPAIPLARGVPVVDVQPGFAEAIYGGLMLSETVARFDEEAFEEDVDYRPDEIGGCLRVDLGGSQGFGYALRWLGLRRGILNGDLLNLMTRHIVGDTTDADRLVLARAIQDIVH